MIHFKYAFEFLSIQSSLSSSLKSTPLFDNYTSAVIDMEFVKQLVLLALHILHVHQHWEKVVALAVKFDDVTR